MKAIKTIGIVVAVVAIAATGVGLALGGAAAASAATAAGAAVATFAGMSAATFATIATVATLAGAAISMGVAAFAPKPGFSNQGNPLNFQTNPQSGLPYCIGRTRMSGVRIHADTYDGLSYKSEGKQDVLSFAVLLSAGGAVEGPLTFRADKETISFNGSTGMASGAYTDWMAQKVSLGVAGASALALAFGGGNFPGWSSAHKLSGITHALWDLRFDPKGNKYGAGVPEPEWTGKWVKVYDPRKDSTFPGGSGSHRAGTESTYEWSANPALHALTWSLGRWQNSKRTLGIGAPVANIRVADFVEAANVADANDWTCGGVEWSTDSKWSVLKRMLQAGGAEPTMTGAMIGCRVNTPRVSIATVTADKLLDSASFPMTRSRRDRFNTGIPRYRSEDHDWEVISGAPIQVAAFVTADGSPRTKEIDFPLVQHETGGNGNEQVGQLTAYEIVNSREAGPWRFTVGPEYVGVKTGDVITLDVPDEGIDEQPVLVRSRSIDPATFKITFEVETETTAKHDFALGKTAVPPPTYTPTAPDLTPPTPDASLWSLIALPDTEVTPSIAIVGACEFPGADAVLMECREDGTSAWQTLGKADAGSPVRHIVSSLIAGTYYEARIAYQSGNRVGDWLVLDPVLVTSVPLNEVLEANDRNAGVPSTTGDISSVTKYMDYPDGNVSYRASFTFTASSTPMHANNVDGFVLGTYAADTNAAHTMVGPEAADENWNVHLGSVPGEYTYTKNFFNNRNPTKYYIIAVAPFRKVDKSVDAKGYIIGPIVQHGPFRPAATQVIAGTNVTVGGQTATNVGTGTTRSLTVINSNNNIVAGVKVGGDSGQDASNVSTATVRGLQVINSNNNIVGTTKIGGDSGQTAADVSTASTRALAAITSGNKVAPAVVQTVSMEAASVNHIFAADVSLSIKDLNDPWSVYVTLFQVSFAVQEVGADLLCHVNLPIEIGITTGTASGQFTLSSRFRNGTSGAYSPARSIRDDIRAGGLTKYIPLVDSYIFPADAGGSRLIEYQVKADDPALAAAYALWNGTAHIEIWEIKR